MRADDSISDFGQICSNILVYLLCLLIGDKDTLYICGYVWCEKQTKVVLCSNREMFLTVACNYIAYAL